LTQSQLTWHDIGILPTLVAMEAREQYMWRQANSHVAALVGAFAPETRLWLSRLPRRVGWPRTCCICNHNIARAP